MRKRQLMNLAVATAIALSLSGCNSGNSAHAVAPSTSATETTSPEKETTVPETTAATNTNNRTNTDTNTATDLTTEDSNGPVYGPVIGITLYTVRNTYNAMYEEQIAAGSTEQEAATYALTSVLHTIADMGYTAYQPNFRNTNWFLMDASELRKLNEELGLLLYSPHWRYVWDYTDEEVSQALDHLHEAGATGITLDSSSAPVASRASPLLRK